MNHHEMYKKAYDHVQESEGFQVDLEKKHPVHRTSGTVIAAVLALFLLIGGVGTAYAGDFGGFRHKIKGWIWGSNTTATVTVRDDGTYQIDYIDYKGRDVTIYTEESDPYMSKEEVLQSVIAELNIPSLQEEDDNRLILTWHDHVVDVTDQFVDGVCYVKMKSDGRNMYVTIIETPESEYPHFFAYSMKDYPNPESITVPDECRIK